MPDPENKEESAGEATAPPPAEEATKEAEQTTIVKEGDPQPVVEDPKVA